jgi:transposase
MARSFYPSDRDQLFLLPPDMRDWLREDHLAYFIIDVVKGLDVAPFYAKYKDGSGQQAYPPEILLTLLLLGYCIGIRSSRVIEDKCQTDVAFRVAAVNLKPDHVTIARFRRDSREELKQLFVKVLELCKEAGLIKVGVLSIDGTKMKANAAMEANRTRKHLRQIVDQVLDEADAQDAKEDKQFGEDRRGDELPEDLRSTKSRAAALRGARERLARTEQALAKADAKAQEQVQQYEQAMQRRADKEREGKKQGGSEPKPPDPQELDKKKANTSDPDSYLVKGRSGFKQGFNAQAAVVEGTQIIVATAIAPAGCDQTELAPMIELASKNLKSVGIALPMEGVVADGGYWSHDALTRSHQLLQDTYGSAAPPLVVAVPSRYAKFKDVCPQDLPTPQNLIHSLEHQQKLPGGQQLYKKRAITNEPVFGQIKEGRRLDRFLQRGEENVEAEWSFMCTTHNLLKLWRHTTTPMN